MLFVGPIVDDGDAVVVEGKVKEYWGRSFTVVIEVVLASVTTEELFALVAADVLASLTIEMIVGVVAADVLGSLTIEVIVGVVVSVVSVIVAPVTVVAL